MSRRNLELLYKLGYHIGERIRFIAKGVNAIYYHDWERIRLYLDKLKENDPLVAGRKK